MECHVIQCFQHSQLSNASKQTNNHKLIIPGGPDSIGWRWFFQIHKAIAYYFRHWILLCDRNGWCYKRGCSTVVHALLFWYIFMFWFIIMWEQHIIKHVLHGCFARNMFNPLNSTENKTKKPQNDNSRKLLFGWKGRGRLHKSSVCWVWTKRDGALPHGY